MKNILYYSKEYMDSKENKMTVKRDCSPLVPLPPSLSLSHAHIHTA